MLNHTISFLLSLLLPSQQVATRYDSDLVAHAPWYHPRTELFANSVGPAQSPPVDLTGCSKECVTVQDCPFDQSCFGATLARAGCCLPALTPNATGCVSDEQCRRSCDSTICDMEQKPSRCLCEPGTHFLFEKCWRRCPSFTYERPEVDDRGFSYCKLRVDERAGKEYMRREKRATKGAFC